MLPVFETMRTPMADLAHPTFLLAVILKGSLILMLALICVRLWRKGSAAMRHLVLGLALTANIILPLAAVLAPTWQAPVLPLVSAQWQFDLAAPTVGTIDETTVVQGRAASGELAGADISLFASPAVSPDVPPAIPWGTWLIWLWIAGAALVTGRLIIALAVVGRILVKAHPLDDSAGLAMARRCREQTGVRHEVPLLISERATVPFTWGWLRPRIILPADSRQWTDRKLEIVMLHELAHIRRWDALSTGIAQLAVIVYWFNPLLWLARRTLLIERERASDDCVLGADVRASEYAGCLLEIARAVRNCRWLPELQVAMAQSTKLEERIMAIVTGPRHRSSLKTSRLAAGLLLSLILILPLAGVQIFAQENDRAEATTTAQVSPAELQNINSLLDDFYRALNRGDDYADVTRRFLTADYFDDQSLTFENWSDARRDQVMSNTISHIIGRQAAEKSKTGGTLRLEEPLMIDRSNPARISYRAEVLECRKIDNKYVLTQKVNIETAGLTGTEIRPLVKDLVQSIELVEENGELKIQRYAGGVNIQRMDVDNPYGPLLIVLLDHEKQSIPIGPMLFKSIPRSLVPKNVNLIPLRADDSDS